nr:type VI secretion system TssO [uncultured Chryseobacterium sp.]
MEVLNQTQRRNAYWFFVLFFILTVSVLIISIFFNTYFPFKENRLLRAENARMKKEMEVQNKFSFQLEKVKVAVDSIGVPKQNDFFNEKLALSILADMYRQLPKDSLMNKNMYNNTIMSYKDLIDAKKQIKQLSGHQETMDSLSIINKKLKEEYDKIRIDLDVCRQLYQAQ